ncbi:hypothetical protein LUCX_121 [Xanthomonas phage vB_XciM_LucasX]|nr:hypothetical protein LUCX_121 [Xanthomonas phage vB_XciM_LucasX]
MPRFAMDVPQTYENIVRPVSLEIAQQLVKMLYLPGNVEVLMPGASKTTKVQGTTLEDTDPTNPASFNHDNRLKVEVTENPVEDRILTTAVHQKENLPFFFDPKLGVRMFPVYSGTELSFTFTYRAENRTLARRFRNEMLSRTSQMREENLHELSYYYLVPPGFVALLRHLHELRENQGGYGQDFDHWVQEHITANATILTNQIGGQPALAIAEFQTNSFGVFQLVGTVEEEEEDKPSGSWLVTFQYKVVFDQVIQTTAQWPLMVHNQLIDAKWYDNGPNASGQLVDPNRRARKPSLSRHALDHFTTVYPSACKTRLLDGVILPQFDEWRPTTVVPETSTLISAMIQIDPTAPTILFNLMEDLGGYQLNPELEEFIKGEAPYMNIRGASIFDLRLFIDDDPMDDDLVVVTPDLTVTTRNVLNIRRNYHIRLALLNNLFLLDDAAWQRLRRGGEAAVQLINCLQYKLLGKAFTPRLLGGYLIRDDDLRLIAQRINDLKVPHKGGLEHVMLTVNGVVIVANRSLENGNRQGNANGAATEGSDPSQDPFTDPTNCGC